VSVSTLASGTGTGTAMHGVECANGGRWARFAVLFVLVDE
jgi:hypothetical protein